MSEENSRDIPGYILLILFTTLTQIIDKIINVVNKIKQMKAKKK